MSFAAALVRALARVTGAILRRAVLGRLSRGPASVSDLARPFDMALPSFMKHIRFLEGTGLIRTRKQGRIRTCELDTKRFGAAERWLAGQRSVWEGHADRLEQYVTALQEKEQSK